ncbi:transglycosylase SLT domain-containing protein [Wenxinia saemankumensis]|uniref:Transglycosylase SLT domain-containing protein n=1 Tax=Wenxinia saemankumensis TaxID=1447782 RepID=A0A1M6CJR2_9RHOB|nr:transglycosylase SLT domain-containing protein [Wenxinia saemankumensis]SHI61163.1 Transglycosylase SLT domain-containing protein [Wenxinia saemankumensis]
MRTTMTTRSIPGGLRGAVLASLLGLPGALAAQSAPLPSDLAATATSAPLAPALAATAVVVPRPAARPELAPPPVNVGLPPARPRARDPYLPAAQWNDESRGPLWTRVMMSALEGHGAEVPATIPADIATWCPGYEQASLRDRRAFWTGLMSGIAYYESRFQPEVVGAGLYHGLLQIYPSTADAVDCRADSGSELQSGTANLSCAVRIMSVVVPDHDVVAAGGRGIANQWGPMSHGWVRDEIAEWTRSQDYCQIAPLDTVPRPQDRPYALLTTPGPAGAPVRG